MMKLQKRLTRSKRYMEGCCTAAASAFHNWAAQLASFDKPFQWNHCSISSLRSTVTSDVSLCMQKSTGEIFGPVLCITTLGSQDGAIGSPTDTQKPLLNLRGNCSSRRILR